MPEKKEKKTNDQSSFEKKFGEAKDSLKETAGKVGEKGKEVAEEIGGRWRKADTEEKICKIVGVILIIGGFLFRSIWALLIPLLLIVFGILFVTGFFNVPKK